METEQKIGCFMTILNAIFLISVVVIMTLWTDRTLDCWCSYFAHNQVDVPTWLSFLIAIIGNGLTLMLNIISEIARLIVGV